MFNRLRQFTLTAALVVATLVPEVGVANALPFQPVTPLAKLQANEILSVQYTKHRRLGMTKNWQFQRHGNRCRTRLGNCRYFHQGYFYQTPWWTLPLILGNQIQRQNSGNSHVRWCLSRYRSYNPRTDLWLGNSGKHYRCKSP